MWQRVQALFEEMLESDCPETVLQRERDLAVAAMAERIYRDHREAADTNFLDEPLTLIRDLTRPEPPQFSTNQVLANRFHIERLLGQGGMGEVYLADDQRLHEKVAIKAIRRGLAASSSMRSQFTTEISAARRVTHPNVCRIFDVFEEGSTAFYAMQYLEGPRLSDWLRTQHVSKAVLRRVIVELAQGLQAAHANKILHCDFKPANVIMTGPADHPSPVITDFGLARALSATPEAGQQAIEAGTPDYMAPELHSGASPSIRSDIFAFGKVALEILPNQRIAQLCIAERPEDRPESLDPVIRKLKGETARRALLVAAVAVPAVGITAVAMQQKRWTPLLSRQRMAFNGFRPESASKASLLRDLLITAVRQSLLVSVVPDERVRSALGKMNFPAKLPADRSHLAAAAVRDGIALLAEGTVAQTGGRTHFTLQIFYPGEKKPALEISEHIDDEKQTVHMAERVAFELRRQFGESESALKTGYAPLVQLTSPYPDAAAFYFRGVRLYENAEAEAAIDWFDQAIRIDPQFALAHLSRGLAFLARFQVVESIQSYERAFALRNRVSERERLWIEASYYNVITDYESSLKAYRRLAALYPDEAAFQRNVAFAYAATGRPPDALQYNRRALELDPSSVNNMGELIVNQAEANQFDAALATLQQFRTNGVSSTLLERGAGVAWMGKGDFDNARRAFERLGQDAKRDRWSRVLRCAPLILQGRFDDAARDLESDLAWDIATKEQYHRLTRRVWLGNLERLMDTPARARIHAEDLVHLDASPVFIEPIREGGLLAAETGSADLAQTALQQLRAIERRWPSTHASGARAHLESSLLPDADRGTLLSQAVGLWADPLTMLSHAQWLNRRKDFAGALAACETLDQQTGRILKRNFPALVVLGWIERARCLTSMSRFEDSLRMYERINNYWLGGPKEFRIIRELREETLQAHRSVKGKLHGRFLGSFRKDSNG